MKYIITLCLFLTGCSISIEPNPGKKFKLGSCVVSSDAERWEENDFLYRIAEIGKKSYRLQYVLPTFMSHHYQTIPFSYESIYRTVPCPTEKQK